jgi:CBS domain-containing membrane protein
VPVIGHQVRIAADTRFQPQDIDAALDELGETFDVSRADLDLLFRIAERYALQRTER